MAIPPGAFLIYTTLRIDLSPIVRTLNQDASYGDIWFPVPKAGPEFAEHPVSSILAHHRSQPGEANKRFLVVVDRPDWETEGVLGVNLNFDGYIDAARLNPQVAGSAIASISVGNSDWGEVISESVQKSRFVLYTAAASDGQNTVSKEHAERLRTEVEAGLGGRKKTVGWKTPAEIVHSSEFTTTVVDEDVTVIAQEHRVVANKLGCHTEFFLVSDEEDFEKWGILVVRIDEGGKTAQFRKPVDVAAEVLQWIVDGILTWQEASTWDDEQKSMEN